MNPKSLLYYSLYKFYRKAYNKKNWNTYSNGPECRNKIEQNLKTNQKLKLKIIKSSNQNNLFLHGGQLQTAFLGCGQFCLAMKKSNSLKKKKLLFSAKA